MFNKNYGSITIKETEVAKRGTCLQATRNDNGFSIYMDIMGAMIPDGVNCYMFGNKLIFVTRWSDFTEKEVETVLEKNIVIGLFSGRKAHHFVIKFGSFRWGDVFTAHSIIPQMNDFDKKVDEAIFIFYDKETGEFIGERCVSLNDEIGRFIGFGNPKAYKTYCDYPNNLLAVFENINSGDELLRTFAIKQLETANNDWCDILYDESFNAIESEASIIRTYDPSEVAMDLKGTVLIEIEGNEVVYVSQNK